MTDQTLLEDRLSALPKRVELPFRQLIKAEQLSEEALTTILDAGDLSGDQSKLLGFAVAYHHLRAAGVPVHDVISMAVQQKRRIRLTWSTKRWKIEHNRLSRAATLLRLSDEYVEYDVSKYEPHLPAKFPGYLIRSSRRLGMEGLRQEHCVASYHNQLARGYSAIASVFLDKRRWTVQLHLNNNLDDPIRISQIKSRHNTPATGDERRAIYALLGVDYPEPNRQGANVAARPDRLYMQNLQRLLPVLRDNGVGRVTVCFDGCGDSGAIDGAYFEPQDFDGNAVTLPVLTFERSYAGNDWVTQRREVEKSVSDAMYQLTDDYLEETGVNWYDNDGGFGELVIDVDEGSVELEVNSRYTNHETEFCSTRDIETGEEIDD